MSEQLQFGKEGEPEPNGQVNEFLIADRLYNGPFSLVFRGTAIRGPFLGKTVALKFLKHRKQTFEAPQIHQEIKLLKVLRHPRIVPILADFAYNGFHCIVFPFAQHGTLEDYAFRSRKRARAKADEVQFIAAQLLAAIAHVHRMGFVHCDIKPENITVHSVIEGFPQIWLCDFGLTKPIPDSSQLGGICGTEFYQSPEMLSRKGYSEKVDEWAAGVVLYRLLTGLLPFMSRREMNENFLEKNFTGTVWKGVPEPAKDLVRALLALDPKKRISAADALRHEWLSPLTKGEMQQEDEDCQTSVPAESCVSQSDSVCAQ